MYLRGPVLIGFSALCIAAAALGHHESKNQAMSRALARAAGGLQAGCMSDGFDTPMGRVGCLTQVSYGLLKDAVGGRSYQGGGALRD